MFLESTSRWSQTQNRRVDYYRLCESYRQDNRTLHFTVVHLGNLEQLPQPEQKQQLARRLEELIEAARRGLQPLFVPQEDVVEQLARHFFRKVLDRKRIDVAQGKDYSVVDINSLHYQLKLKETHNEWRDIVRIMNTQKIVTTTMENNRNDLIIIRQCSEPSQKVMEIYHNLGFKPQPFSRKKFVVPKTEIPPAQSFDNQLALSG